MKIKKIAVILTFLTGLVLVCSPLMFVQRVQATGTITGVVYVDYNMNGARNTSAAAPNYAVDEGAGGVTVTAYDAGGTARGTATSCTGLNNPTAFCTGLNNGAYSLSASGTGPYRIEFTNLPSGSYPSIIGTNNSTTVRFVADGNSSNIDLGIVEPTEYCQNIPFLVTSSYVVGSGTFDTLVRYPYSYSDELDGRLNSVDATAWTTPPSRTSLLAPTGIATVNPIGATFGLAWNARADKLYSAAYLKRGARFGSLSSESTGAIYATAGANGASPATSLFVDLNAVFGAGTAGANPHTVASTPDWTVDTATIAEVGKRGLGGLKLSKDGATLYAVNLADKKLYAIPTSGTLDSMTITRFDIPTSNLATSSGNCASADVRPFGIGRDGSGQIYVGAVCSAESETANTKLHAFVWRFNGSAFTLAANNNLTFTRTATTGEAATWQRWANTTGVLNRAAPMLTDIDFDGDDMLIALRDRYGDQVVLPEFYRGYGDLMRACANGSNFNFESNGSCGGVTAGGIGTGEGNGGGEYYADLNGDGREEGGLGGLVQVPGFNHVITTFYDPVTYNSAGTRVSNFYTAGVQRYSNTTGAMVGAYDVYLDADSGTFGKADGNGDSEVLCDAAPIQIGNRVWRDTDGDGVQDADETGIQGITVRLYRPGFGLDGIAGNADDNQPLAIAVTSASGQYRFINGTAADADTTNSIGILNGKILNNTAYEIRLDLAADYSSGALNGLLLTTRDQTVQLGFDEGTDSDASSVTSPVGSPAGTFPVISLTTGGIGENNHTFDVGFTSSATFSLGNRVWFDTDNDGQIDASEVGISGVQVKVYNATDTTFSSPLLTSQTTDANGYYRFDGLAAGNYVVRVEPSNFANAGVLGGRQNTSGSTGSDSDSTVVAGQNGEDGINPAGAANSVQTVGIVSGIYTLGAPGEPTNEADVLGATQGAFDAAANLTVDYGFYRLNLGGTIWRDTGAGANNNNGILNAGESGIASVRVQIYSGATEILVGADGILGTSDDGSGGMLTSGAGNYNFQGLPAGTYRVAVTPPGGNSSTPTSAAPDNNIDSDDNGFPNTTEGFSSKIISGLVTLTPGNAGALNNNAVNNANGSTSNPTVDFGFTLAPTAVRLENFEAFTDGGSVELRWSTGEEAGNLGFNIYREVGGKRRLLNSSPIAGNALRTSATLVASGNDYSWTDKESSLDAVYYLEDVDLKGDTNLHGAVTPQFRLTLDNKANARLLSDLTNEKNSSGERAIIGGQTFFNPKDKKSSVATVRQQQIAALGGAKISINHDGWYRVSAEQLQAAGFDTNSKSDYWQLYADGAEVPFKLNADDSIEFFGRGLDTPLTDRQVYYLINNQKIGLRINSVDVGGAAGETADARSYDAAVERKDRVIYSSSIVNGEADNWFGAVVSQTNQTVQNLTVRNLDANGRAHLSVKLQGAVAVKHSVNVKFNDVELGTIDFDGFENRQFEFDLPAPAVREGVNSVRLQSIGASNDVSLVDTIRLDYRRGFAANENRLRFIVPANQTVRVGGFSEENIKVYEIQNGAAQRQVVGTDEKADGTYGFSLSAANEKRELFAVTDSSVEQPAIVERNAPSSWNKPENEADFVIVTSNELRSSAEKLAAMREAQNLKTQVVLIDDLFDEFTFGMRSPEAVRQFLKIASRSWKLKPRYALLFGDASYDSRNRLGLNATRDIVPTKTVDTEFMETSSDAWLADFDGDGAEDIALGRIPVGDAFEAAAAIEKLARFDSQNVRAEKSAVFVSDRAFENYSADLQTLLPNDMRVFRVDRSALSDAEMHRNIVERLNDDPLVVTYSGHGSSTVWANSSVFRAGDAAGLANDKLSFYLLMTCLNGYASQPNGESLAESLFNSERGAIAVWSSSGTTQAETQFEISRAFTRIAFDAAGKPLRIGEVVRAAKLATDDADVRRTWQLVGDPTVFIK